MANGLVWLWGLFACSPVHRIPAPEPAPAVLPPTVARAQYLRGQLMAASGDIDAAEYYLSRARIFDADEPRILMALGSVKMTRGDVDGARTFFSDAVTMDPNSADAWLAHGRTEMAFGDKAVGRSALRKALTLGGFWSARAMLVADALRGAENTGMPHELVEWVEQTVEDPVELRRRGELRMIAGDASGAVDDFLNALERTRQDVSLVGPLVRAATIGQRLSSVLMEADALVQSDPNAKAYWPLLGRLSALIADHEHVIASFENAAALGVEWSPADQKIVMSARKALQSSAARTSGPPQSFPKTSLGQILMLMEDRRWEEAEKKVEEELVRDGADPQMLYILAQINFENGGPKTALPFVEKAVSVASDFAPGLNLWAWVHAENGTRLAEATEYAQDALRHQPHIGGYWDTLGWVLMRRGEYERALPILERAVRLSPNDDAVRARRDSCRASIGSTPQ